MLESVLNQLRQCPSCGTSWGEIPWLCSSCFRELNRNLRLRHRWINPNLDHYYLFDWTSENGLKPIVHSLKGGRLKWPFYWLSLSFPRQGLGKGPLFYPSRGRPDHASALGESLGARWNRKTQAILGLGKGKQSLKSRAGRQRARFESLNIGEKHVDFIDDIVTTGGTAMACFEALPRSSKMTVWSLFYRKPL